MTAADAIDPVIGLNQDMGLNPVIGLIWAEAKNRVIGDNGVMPWHLPEDLAHFKATTLGSAVVMGRRTWDSLPERFRPLAGRTNIVITRQPDWHADGAVVVHSLDEALAAAALANRDGAADAAGSTAAAEPAENTQTVWIIGGGQVYAEALPRAGRVSVTELDLNTNGDTVAPELSDSEGFGPWRATRDPESGWLTSRTGIVYRFVDYRRDPSEKLHGSA